MNHPAGEKPPLEILPQRNPTLPDAIRDAQVILSHTAKMGTTLDPEMVKKIVDIGSLATTQEISVDQEADFWLQKNKLSKAVAPLNIESLHALTAPESGGWILGPSSQARKAELRYRWYAIVALFFLLVFQIYWLFGSSVTSEIAKTDKELNEAYAKQLVAKKLVPQQSTKTKSTGSAVTNSDDTKSEELQVLNAQVETFEMRQQSGYRLLEEWAWPWSWLVPESNCGNDTKAREEIRMNAARFQTGLTILEVFQRYILALLYGFLGACVFVLRTLSDEIKAWTYSETSDIRFRIRLYLGTLGGMVIAWFVAPESSSGLLKSLSPFALAFVAGYNVELLFAAMDKVIAAFAGSPSNKDKDRPDAANH